MASSGGYYSGRLELDGKKRVLTLVDGNVNGTFNDCASNPYEADRIEVEDDKAGERFLGRFLEVGKSLYRVEPARDGALLNLEKMENVPMGTVRLPEAISRFTAFGEAGHFIRVPSQGETQLPVGRYRVQGWTIDRKDEKGVPWTLTGSGFSDYGSSDVAGTTPVAGEPAAALVAWWKLDETTGPQTLIAKGDQGWQLRTDGQPQRLTFSLNGPQTTGKDRKRSPRATSTTALTAGRWHHIVETYNGQKVGLYVDGALAESVMASGPLALSTDPIWIGNNSTARGEHFDGGVDDVRLYRRGLSDEEVRRLHRGDLK